jgi:hypothetical protein
MPSASRSAGDFLQQGYRKKRPSREEQTSARTPSQKNKALLIGASFMLATLKHRATSD